MEFSLEIAIGIVEAILGVVAIFTLSKAKGLLGGVWGESLAILVWASVCFTAQAFWHTIREAFELKEKYGVQIEYPEYFLGAAAFVLLLFSAKKILDLAQK